VPCLVVSALQPTSAEVNTNISSFYNSELLAPPVPTGISQNRCHLGNVCMLDHLSLECTCELDKHCGVPWGLCHKHGKAWKSLQVTDYALLKAMKDAADSTEKQQLLYYAKDATVVAIAPVAPLPPTNLYHAIPVVVSPMCKEDTTEDLVDLIETVAEAWKAHPEGEKKCGPIVTFASDGNATSRAARHHICTAACLKDVDWELYNMLSRLPGLNLQVSEDGATHTCDFKHIWKRESFALYLCLFLKYLEAGFCMLMRGKEGIFVFGVLLVPEDFKEVLMELGYTQAQADKLFDWKDKQNVPKARRLLLALRKFIDLPQPQEQRLQKECIAICFLAELLGCFLLPFIDHNMSLKEQVENLSTYAHLTAAIQVESGTSCLTGPVYADSQASVKNLVFDIARAQLVDSNLKLYIMLDDTDRLELLFSAVCTLNHARDVNAKQLGLKLGTAAAQEAIYLRHPELGPGSKCLQTKAVDGEGVDHKRLEQWKDELVTVGNVDLEAAWKQGRLCAEEILQKYFPDIEFDFDKQFLGWESTHNFLRLSGEWVGLSPDENDTKSEHDEEAAAAAKAASADLQPCDDVVSTGSDTSSASGTSSATDSDAVSSSNGLLAPIASVSAAIDSSTAVVQLVSALGPRLPSTNILQPAESAARLVQPPEVVQKLLDFDLYLTINGKQYKKISMVPRMLTMNLRLSTDRNRCVQGQTCHGDASGVSNKSDGSVVIAEDVDTIERNNFVGSLVRTASGVGLAVFQVHRLCCGGI
jgi:hypothetical protein